jgi:prepilin-type N-terminal cleavage/methylation domain-containing protein
MDKIANRPIGFTLLELLIVICVLAILSGSMWSQYRITQAQTRDARRSHDIEQLTKSLNYFKYTGNELVNYSGNTLTTGETSLHYNDYYDCWHQHYYPIYYPIYNYCDNRSKVEQAFKIVGKLLEKDLIKKELTVKEFIKLVNDIAEII